MSICGSFVSKRLVHSIARSGQEATTNETPIVVYDSPECLAFEKAWQDANGDAAKFDTNIAASGFKPKYCSLFPFFFESKFTKKSFIIKMELFPQADYLKLYSISLMGVTHIYMPIK